MLNFNFNLIYNPTIIAILSIIIILVVLVIYYLYYYQYYNYNYNDNELINFEITPVTPTRPTHVTYYNHSLIDKYPPNNDKFPEFKKAKSYKVELNPGSSLFIPAGWWHWVFSEGNCIAFSHIIHNFDEDNIKEKQTHDYKAKSVKYYNNITRSNGNENVIIDFTKHSNESIPLVYNDSNINIITESFLQEKLDKINLLLSKTSTIVTVNKPNNTTLKIINGQYKYFTIVNNSPDFYGYIGMNPLNKEDFSKFINTEWEALANNPNEKTKEKTKEKIKKKNDIYLWHSKKKIDTGLHYDITDNLLTLHSGKKTVMLFPPSESKYLYNELLNNTGNYGVFKI